MVLSFNTNAEGGRDAAATAILGKKKTLVGSQSESEREREYKLSAEASQLNTMLWICQWVEGFSLSFSCSCAKTPSILD